VHSVVEGRQLGHEPDAAAHPPGSIFREREGCLGGVRVWQTYHHVKLIGLS